MNVKGLADLLWRLALDHIRNSLAPDIKERLNIKIVGGLREALISDVSVGGAVSNDLPG